MKINRVQVSLNENQSQRLQNLVIEANENFQLGKVNSGAIIGQLIERAKINVEELQRKCISEKLLLEKIKTESDIQKKAELSRILTDHICEASKSPQAVKKGRPKNKEVTSETTT